MKTDLVEKYVLLLHYGKALQMLSGTGVTKSKHKQIIDDEVVITTCLTQPRLLIEISQGHIYDMKQQWNGTNKKCASIGQVNEYPTMHYFGNPRHTQSMMAY